MKSLAVFSLALGLSVSGVSAKTLQFPADPALGQVDASSKIWKVEQDSSGDIKLSHKKGDIFVGVMTVDASKAEAVVKKMIESISEGGLSYDQSTVKTEDNVKLGHLKNVSEMTAVAHKGKPYHVVFDFVPFNDKKMGIVFLLADDADAKAYSDDLDKLSESFDLASAEDDDEEE